MTECLFAATLLVSLKIPALALAGTGTVTVMSKRPLAGGVKQTLSHKRSIPKVVKPAFAHRMRTRAQTIPGPGTPERYPERMATQADRAAERRVAKLEDVERQLKEGSLTIRKMTAEERKRFPPRPAKPRKGSRR